MFDYLCSQSDSESDGVKRKKLSDDSAPQTSKKGLLPIPPGLLPLSTPGEMQTGSSGRPPLLPTPNMPINSIPITP